jgi:glycerophosphoryl diester phosphodiesterase
MKLIAHRGWSAGRGENSLAAFARAARDGRVSGVEFDVCLAADSDTLVVSHDPPRHVENALTSMRHCRFFQRLTLNCLWR